MCNFCSSLNEKYKSLLLNMLEEDKQRINNSKFLSSDLPTLGHSLYSSIDYPVKLLFPMFDACAAYSVPTNYYQPLYLDSEKCSLSFSHGSMRSVFFNKDMMIVFSKSVSEAHTKEFFSSFILAHFKLGELNCSMDSETLTISADKEKAMRNLVTGKTEKKRVSFNFTHSSVLNRIVSKEKIMTSSYLKSIYARYGGIEQKMSSADLYSYAVTVPHFAPHPYMLQTLDSLGFKNSRELQEHVLDYFRAHLRYSPPESFVKHDRK